MEGEGKKVQWDSNVSGRQMVVPPAKTGSIWRKTGLLVGEGAGGKARRRGQRLSNDEFWSGIS